MTEIVNARVASKSRQYADGVEQLTLDVMISKAGGLSIPPKHESLPITLVLNSAEYAATFRTSGSYIYVSPALKKAGGEKARLADVLLAQGLQVSEHVRLRVDGDRVHVVAGSVD